MTVVVTVFAVIGAAWLGAVVLCLAAFKVASRAVRRRHDWLPSSVDGAVRRVCRRCGARSGNRCALRAGDHRADKRDRPFRAEVSDESPVDDDELDVDGITLN